MQFKSTIVNGKIVFSKDFLKYIEKQKDGRFTIDIKKLINPISALQQRSLHLWFSKMSERFNELGIDMRTILKETFFLFWTPYGVKEYLWRQTQKNMFGIESTKDINSIQTNKIFEVIHQAVIDITKGEVDIPWPCEEEKQIEWEKNNLKTDRDKMIYNSLEKKDK